MVVTVFIVIKQIAKLLAVTKTVLKKVVAEKMLIYPIIDSKILCIKYMESDSGTIGMCFNTLLSLSIFCLNSRNIQEAKTTSKPDA